MRATLLSIDSSILSVDCVEFFALLLKLQILRLDILRLDVLAAGCPVVGREMLATGFPNDCFLLVIPSQRASADLYALALLLVFLHLLIVTSLLTSSTLIQILRFSSQLLIVMTSSLLLIASSRMYADVITAVSRFLSISNADVNVAAPIDSSILSVDCVEFFALLLKLQILRLDILCLDVLASGCLVVGREMLATGFPNDCFLLVIPSQRASADLYALALLLVFLHLMIVTSLLTSSTLIQLLRFSSQLLIVMTSSLLLIASSRMYADVITAVSRFLSISNADVNIAARSFLQYMC
ncbi:hypothetical protein F511_11865 [Dorcoceras hygrometricum]|uniref:Uncharacterized protein n=1 Tax=Dorcoceras hygrometricum TaxID=472368 RepID=A0A2Z7A419_9LAMI|nr:hypothetical protein F511_11865 [Dorcoceras hygrometricum]